MLIVLAFYSGALLLTGLVALGFALKVDKQRVEIRKLNEKNRALNKDNLVLHAENRDLKKHLELPPHKRPFLELPRPKKEERPLKLPDLTGVPGPVALFIAAATAAIVLKPKKNNGEDDQNSDGKSH